MQSRPAIKHGPSGHGALQNMNSLPAALGSNCLEHILLRDRRSYAAGEKG